MAAGERRLLSDPARRDVFRDNAVIDTHADRIGQVQIADTPGRSARGC